MKTPNFKNALLMSSRLWQRFTLAIVACLMVVPALQAQTTLSSSVVNAYYPVTGITGTTVDFGARAGATHTWSVGDKAMLIQMDGSGFTPRGVFELQTVTSVASGSVTLSSVSEPFDPTSKVQLVYVPNDNNGITTTTDINAMPWNGSTGGVIALCGSTLTLGGDIDATCSGFSIDNPPAGSIHDGVTPDDIFAANSSGGGGIFGGGAASGGIVELGFDFLAGGGGTITSGGVAVLNGYPGGEPGFPGAGADVLPDHEGAAGSGGGSYGGGGASGSHRVIAGGDDSAGGSGGGSFTGGGCAGLAGTFPLDYPDGNPGNPASTTNITNDFHYFHDGDPRLMMGANGGNGSDDMFIAQGGAGGGIVYLDFSGPIDGGGHSISSDGKKGQNGYNGIPEGEDIGGGGAGGGAGGQIYVSASCYTNVAGLSANGGMGGDAGNGAFHGAGSGAGGGGGGIWIEGPSLQSNAISPFTVAIDGISLISAEGGTGGLTAINGKNNRMTHTGGCGGEGLIMSTESDVFCVYPEALVQPEMGTCEGSSTNDDATISLTSVVDGDEANISTGASYTGPAYGASSGLDVSGGSVTFTGLSHNTQYTVRIFNESNSFFTDYTVTTPDCVTPTAGITSLVGTCDGLTANNDASILLSNVLNGDEASYSLGMVFTGSGYGDVANLDVSSGSGTITGLEHDTEYIVRIYNGSNDIFTDYTVSTPEIECTLPCERIGGAVWVDANNNGCQDPNENTMASGVTVNIWECDPDTGDPSVNIASVSTIGDGTWSYGGEDPTTGECLLEHFKSYTAQFVLPTGVGEAYEGYVLSANDGGFSCTNVDSETGVADACYNPLDNDAEDGASDEQINAGVVPPVFDLTSISATAWHDIDGDGIQDGDEPTIGNIRVELYDELAHLISVTYTDENGQYTFEDLNPADYYLKFFDPEGFELTLPNVGGDDLLDSDVDGSNGAGTTQIFTLEEGEDETSFNAGYYRCVEIGEIVWFDSNKDHIRDDIENGINGIRVELYREVGGTFILWDAVYTGHKPGTPSDDGYWKVCTAPGTYYVKYYGPPYGLVPTNENVGNDESRDSDVTNANGEETTDTYTFSSGESNCNIGAGYAAQAIVGDRVWLDNNFNGQQDLSEAGVEGVNIRLRSPSGATLKEVQTDEEGKYSLDELQAKEYYIEVDIPDGYAATAANIGDDDWDSDLDHSMGENTTGLISLKNGDDVPHIDIGLTSTVLPATWLGFTGEFMGTHNALTWTLASEIDIDRYEIEKSTDGNTFTKIGEAVALGIPEYAYTFEDYAIEKAGTYYYRIKSVDLNSNTQFSQIISIRVNHNGVVATATGSIYPNPNEGLFTVELTLERKMEKVSVDIFDARGTTVMTSVLLDTNADVGVHRYTVDASHLSAGMYELLIRMDENQLTKKVIIVSNKEE